MASRRKRGPVALRPQLSLGLPLSNLTRINARQNTLCKLGDLLSLEGN